MTALVMLPRDGMFLKDGREWGSVMTGHAYSLAWPAPSTLRGALCTACGREQEQRSGTELKPAEWKGLLATIELRATLALRRRVTAKPEAWAPEHRVWPVPADALFFGDPPKRAGVIRRLDPGPAANGEAAAIGRRDLSAAAMLWRASVVDPSKPDDRPPNWWCDAAFLAWLTSDNVERAWDAVHSDLSLPRHVQAHVGIDPATQAARDEILFAHEVVEALESKDKRNFFEWGIGCRVTLPDSPPTGHAMLGGDRRLARIESADTALFDQPPPDLLRVFEGKPRGLRLIAVTPAAFKRGWLPDGFEANGDAYRGRLGTIADELILRAAFVPHAGHVSGYDMAKHQPKQTTRTVPAGSVFHLMKADETATFTRDDAKHLWLSQFGQRTDDGFGCFVPGIWHPQGSAS